MTTATSRPAVAMRFIDGDTVSLPGGTKWIRGIRQTGEWSTPGAPDARSDKAMRSALTDEPTGATFAPALPNVFQPLPGTECGSSEALHQMVLRPATGGVLYTSALNRVQSFLGNESGVLRSNNPTPLALAAVRASLLGTVRRHPRASINYHRIAGRLYARYAVGQAVHTHVYILTVG